MINNYSKWKRGSRISLLIFAFVAFFLTWLRLIEESNETPKNTPNSLESNDQQIKPSTIFPKDENKRIVENMKIYEYYALSNDEKFKHLKDDVLEFMNQSINCETTKFVSTSSWCDSNFGNGLDNLLRTLLVGYLLNRPLIIFVHRKSNCEQYLNFLKPSLVFQHGTKYHSMDVFKKCNLTPTVKKINMDYDSLACQNILSSADRVLEVTDIMGADFTKAYFLLQQRGEDAEFDNRLRMRMIRTFDIGIFTTIGLLMEETFSLQKSVIKALETEYHPGPKFMTMLHDPNVLKVGLHIRHLPFVVADENGPNMIDKRARKCLQTALIDSLSTKTSCLIILASDMPDRRAEMVTSFRSVERKCEVMALYRTSNSTNSTWGGPSYSQWENRDPMKDRRGLLEAYLDFYIVSQFADSVVFSMGSTFSKMMALRASGKPSVGANYEFPASSCKPGYLPFPCCLKKQRFDETHLFVRSLANRCPKVDRPS